MLLSLAVLLVPAAGLAAKPKPAPARPNAINTAAELQDVTASLNKSTLPIVSSEVAAAPQVDAADNHKPVIGELRNWLGLDFVGGFFYRKQYQLRGAFMTALHRNDLNGLDGLQAVLDQFAPGTHAMDVLHDWAVMVALDGVIDAGAKLRGAPRKAPYQTPTLHATITWDTPEAYSTPGAPPNGSDYVGLRNTAGTYLNAGQVDSISFNGASTLTTDPSVEGSVPDIPAGWWIDDVAVGGTVIEDGASLDDWGTPTQIRPIPVSGFTVQIIGYSTSGSHEKQAVIGRISLDASFDATLDRGFLRRTIGNQADVVAVIVTYDDPTETVTQYACYTLQVNGVTQPGGC